MSYNGSGLFQINTAGQPVVTGTVISSTAFNALTADLATGLSTALTKDGQTTPTANIPMGTFKITGLGNGTAATDSAAFGQLTAFGVPGYTTTATAAGTTTLSVTSTQQQYFTGVTTQTVVLPVTSTLVLGHFFRIVNNSTGVVSVNSSGGNLVVALVPNSQAIITCILTSGTTAASWDLKYAGFSAVTGTGSAVLWTGPTIASPTITTSPTAAGATWTNLGAVTTADINGGTIDGAVIGGSAAAAGTFAALTATGQIVISGASAGQIVFPATQNPSSNANTLDDYEEGTFTPTVQGTSTAGSGTYTLQLGTYVKIGRLVWVQANMNWTTHTGTGDYEGAGLPFASQNTSNLRSSLAVWSSQFTYTVAGQLGLFVNTNATTLDLFTFASAASRSSIGLATDVSGQVAYTGSYIAAS